MRLAGMSGKRRNYPKGYVSVVSVSGDLSSLINVINRPHPARKSTPLFPTCGHIVKSELIDFSFLVLRLGHR